MRANADPQNTVPLQNDTASQDRDFWGLCIPFMDALGVIPEHIEANYARTRLPYRHDLRNSRGHVHGGALMSVLDFTMSAAARGGVADTAGMATITMETRFMEPCLTDLIVTGRCLRQGKSIAFCEGEIRDPQGKLLCKASASFKVMRVRGGD